MTNLALRSRLLDNHQRGTVGEYLRTHLRLGADLSVVSAYFTIYAHAALKDQLDALEHVRFLFGEPRFIRSLDPQRDASPAFRIEDDAIQIAERLRQSRAARDCADWFRERVEVRSIRKPGFVHGKMYGIHHGDYRKAVLGSSNFTVQGLGLGARPNYELNLEVTDERDREDLGGWFEQLWSDHSLVEDVKAEVLLHLQRMYVPHSPQFIYYKTLFHLFSGFHASDQAELKQPEHLYDSAIWNTLFEFQQHGVQAAIRKLETYGGCILADSVGLGKTYTALATIKYFENLNYRVLVLCPKKLRDNWTIYQAQNNSPLNPFMGDRFAFTVLSHTDLSRESGRVGDIQLGSLNWGNYDLVVIDESHNFRNNTRGRRDESGATIKKSRYERLMHDIIGAGIPTKVMLLSATPVNNDLIDLRNQLMLMSGGEDGQYSDTLGVPSVKSALDRAQKTFQRWSEKPDRRAVELLAQLDPRLFTLLDGLTLARSREHIKRYYPDTLAALGGFPQRAKPRSVYADVDKRGLFPPYAAINAQILAYKLSLFSPSRYLRADLAPDVRAQYLHETTQNFSQAKREGYLIGMMKVNFLKRLESAVPSFALTLERTLAQIRALEMRLEHFMHDQTAATIEAPDAETLGDEEGEAAVLIGRKVRYDLRHLDVARWQADLASDREGLEALYQAAHQITPSRDAKLAALKEALAAKIAEPTVDRQGRPSRKALVFTAFADTARYLYAELEAWARGQGVHIGLVVGDGDNKTTLGRAGYGDILTNFAPRAKRRAQLPGFPEDQEIDVLIATDCISEGQNLQDCDLLINYDIHWNPVRLIQRFGRIDRIGSQNDVIQMVNFWPTDDLNAYLNLRARVEARMALVDLTATAQDNPLAESPTGAEAQVEAELSYRDRQLLRLRDEVFDLEEADAESGGLSLSDFSLDDFRMDLSAFLESARADLAVAPLGLHGIVAAQGEVARPGIIFCLRQAEGQDTGLNPLHPYFLVYVREGGEVRFTPAQARQTLDLYRALCAGKAEADQALHDLFDAQTDAGAQMDGPNRLLSAALAAIRHSAQAKTAQSLFAGRGALLPKAEDQVDEETPFELITWLIIGQGEVKA